MKIRVFDIFRRFRKSHLPLARLTTAQKLRLIDAIVADREASKNLWDIVEHFSKIYGLDAWQVKFRNYRLEYRKGWIDIHFKFKTRR